MIKQSLFIVLFISSIFSGQIEFDRFTIDDGLSQNTVYEIFQDSRGYIWMGTQGGLDRFNGYEFKQYEHESTDSTTIVDGYIRCINEDEDGLLWLGTSNGNLGWFDPFEEIGGSVDLYKDHTGINRPDRIENIFFHKDDIFLATIGSGLCRYNKTDGSILWYREDSTAAHYIKGTHFNSVFSISDNELVIGDRDILVLNTETNIHTKPYNDWMEKELGFPADSLGLTHISRDGKGNWYLGIWNTIGLIVLNVENQTASQHFPLPKVPETGKYPRPMVKEVTLDKTGKVWMSLYDRGVTIFDPETKTFKKLAPEKDNANSISDNRIESIMKDRSGAMWLGGNRSLMKHDPEKKKFNIIANSPTADIRTSFSEFWGLFIDSNEDLWAGSVYRGDGVEQINLKTKEVTHHIPKSAKEGKGISFWFLREDAEGRLWGRTIYDLHVSDKNKQNFKSGWDISNVTFKETGGFGQFLLDSKNRFWVFTQKKTWWVEFQGDSINWTDVASVHESMKGIVNVRGNAESKNNKFYLFLKAWNEEAGFKNDQLLKISKDSFTVDTLYDHKMAQKKIPGFDGSITSIYEASDGLFWFTSYGEGITKLNIETMDMTHYGKKDGLPNSYIYSIYEDDSGHMWMPSNYGIIKFDPKTETFRQFGMADGIQNFEYNQSADTQMKDGTLFFGGLSGINYFNPNTLNDNPNEPTVIIESFTKTDSVFIIHKSSTSDETYNVYYNEKDLSFRFAAIDYRNPSQNEHAYMMQGYDNDWHYSGGRRYASYTNLPPGDYTFRVKGSNNDGVWNESGASLKLKIHPAPWETTWAYMLYFATAGFGVFGYVRRQQRLQAFAMEQERKEAELEEARQFQLDMLPKDTPEDLDLDIAAAIETASEVGGDYYDYFPQDDKKSLYVVVGDATGHGMTAGMMVSITKAGLYGIPSIPPNDIAKRLNRVIKNIDLGWNRMAFNMARFWEDKVEFTSAAMPPVYHFHGETGGVDEILIEGLPLGSIKDETFTLKEFDFKKDDSLVFISDGLPEATNHAEEMLGYEAVMDCVKANGHQGAEEQKQALLDLGAAWLGGLRNQDDITIVVVKKK